MPFDYPYTCPDIDDEIKKSKDFLEGVIDDLFIEASPLLSYETRAKLVEEWTKTFYDGLEEYFEGVRETNSKIRDAATDKVNDLEQEIENMREEYVEDL